MSDKADTKHCAVSHWPLLWLHAECDHFDTEQNEEVCSRLSAGFAAFRSGRDERKHLEQIKQCLPFAFLLIFFF